MISLEENRGESSEGETEEEVEEEEEKPLPFLHGAMMENDLCQEVNPKPAFRLFKLMTMTEIIPAPKNNPKVTKTRKTKTA